MIIKHHINERQIVEALHELSSSSIETATKKELLYKHAHIFFKMQPGIIEYCYC